MSMFLTEYQKPGLVSFLIMQDIENVTKLPNNYQNYPMPFTPEFKDKLKELV